MTKAPADQRLAKPIVSEAGDLRSVPHDAVPRISICLPTYNRSGYLAQSLASIVDAVRHCDIPIEIIVNDNASTDDTETVARSFSSPTLDVRYFRNSENVGANRNLVVASSHARGKYVWLFGDDDLFLPDALSIAANALRDDPDAVVFDFEIRDRDCAEVRSPTFFKISQPILFTDRDKLLSDVNGKLGLLSCMLMKREIWNRISPEEHEIYVPTGLNHVYAFYAMLPERPKVRLQNGPAIAQRADNSGGYDWVKYFVEGFAIVYRDLEQKGYSRRSIRAAKSANCVNVLAGRIVLCKIERIPAPGVLGELLKHYGALPMFWLAVFPLWLAPRPAILLMRRVKKIAQALLRR